MLAFSQRPKQLAAKQNERRGDVTLNGDRLFYLMIVVIALIGVGLFAIPVKADDLALTTIGATAEQQSQSSLTLATSLHKF